MADLRNEKTLWLLNGLKDAQDDYYRPNAYREVSSATVFPTSISIADSIAVNETLLQSGLTIPITYEVLGGSLPTGLTLTNNTNNTATISGTTNLDVGTEYDFTIVAFGQNGYKKRRYIGQIVSSTIPSGSISPSSLPDMYIDQPYSQQLTALGGVAPYTFSIDSGSLPSGFTLSLGGLISGTPTTLQMTSFVVRATDSNTNFINRLYVIAVIDPVAGQGNLTDAWFGGGFPVVSTVDRIIFLNDTATAIQKGPLLLARYNLASSGNLTDAWFGGGSPGPVSTVDRIIFLNDTATAIQKGPLSAARYSLASSGNLTDAWFGGGSPGPVSTVDRIIFLNDTATAIQKSPLLLARRALAASGNLTDAWFGGGTPTTTTVDRIIFSNDTATAIQKGPLLLARRYLAASGNLTDAWFGGGFPVVSTVDRIIFLNDTATAIQKGPLLIARDTLAASS